jgi:SAM-dependent methyltransferase
MVVGGVAHVRGELPNEEQRSLARGLLRQQGGLYAVWDLLTLPGETLTVLDIGAGQKKQAPEALGVDRVPYPGVDVVTDLEGPLPFAENSVDHIFAVHVLEHIHDLLGAMRELHRILRPTGALHVLAPYWRHINAVADPTHVRLMDVQTLRYFTTRRPGVKPWWPLLAHQTDDTVFADLQPVKDGALVERGEIARWFY